MSKTIKWGIMGSGGIARHFAKDVALSKGAELVAIGSRSLETAEKFASSFNIPNIHGSYEQLVADPNIDIVYIATPHPEHKRCALMCINAGKAILCEKPFAMNYQETADIINAARAKKVFAMEAMWSRYFPAIRKVKEWIRDGAIGDVKMINTTFGFKCPWDPEWRLLNKELGGGAALDVGIYTASFASFVYEDQPVRIASSAHIGSTDVDEWFAAIFDYGDGRMAVISNAIRLPLQTEATIYGTEGRIEIPNFIAAKDATLYRRSKISETFIDEDPRRGMFHEAEEATRCMLEGLLESPEMPLDETLAIMGTLDELRRPWNDAH